MGRDTGRVSYGTGTREKTVRRGGDRPTTTTTTTVYGSDELRGTHYTVGDDHGDGLNATAAATTVVRATAYRGATEPCARFSIPLTPPPSPSTVTRKNNRVVYDKYYGKRK